MILTEVALSACLLLNVTPSVAKKCEKIVEKRCFERNLRSYKDCFEKVAPEINVLMKKQYAKACLLQ
jgi:hypothetical protein